VHKAKGEETIQGRKVFKGGNYMRKYGMLKKPIWSAIETTLFYYCGDMYSWSNIQQIQ
jgi:hypothetical protein